MRAACAALLSTALGLPAAAQESAPSRCSVQPDGDHVVVSSPADGFGIRLIGPAWSVTCSERDGLLARSPLLVVSIERRTGAAPRARPPEEAPHAAATARRSDGVVLDLYARWAGPRAALAGPERAQAVEDLLAVQLDSFVLLESLGGSALAALPTE